MWFPHYELNAVYNKCEIVPTPVKVPSDREMIFFVHDRLRRHQKRSLYFNIAIRDAWLELKANRQVFDRMHRLIVSDQTYMKFVKRCAGLHYITEQHC